MTHPLRDFLLFLFFGIRPEKEQAIFKPTTPPFQLVAAPVFAPVRVAPPEENMPGWLGQLLSHGLLTQASFLHHLIDHAHYSAEWRVKPSTAATYEVDRGNSKLWVKEFALFPPPMCSLNDSKYSSATYLGPGIKHAGDDHYPTSDTDYTWAREMPYGVMNPANALWRIKKNAWIAHHFQHWGRYCRDYDRLVGFNFEKDSPAYEDDVFDEDHLKDGWKGMWPAAASPGSSYQARLVRYYQTGSWLVWAAEAWRIHNGEHTHTEKSDGSLDAIWRRHCIAWGVGCANRTRYTEQDTQRDVDGVFRIEHSEYTIHQLLWKVMHHTPPPGTLETGTELDHGRLCEWPDTAGGLRPGFLLPAGWNAAIAQGLNDDWNSGWFMKYYKPAWVVLCKAFASYVGAGAASAVAGAVTAAVSAAVQNVASASVEAVISDVITRCISASFDFGAQCMVPSSDTFNYGRLLDVVVAAAGGAAASYVDGELVKIGAGYSLEQARNKVKDYVNSLNRDWGYSDALVGSYTSVSDLNGKLKNYSDHLRKGF